ncbi:MAG TPA: hypothetical protein VK196_21285, partial [Magnetospirillum sp.]|nr:hypothetical protein [Magnetospirillum sp.]
MGRSKHFPGVERRSTADLSRYLLGLAALVVAVVGLWAPPCRAAAPGDASPLEQAEDYLWMGMAADGDPWAFDSARAILSALPPEQQSAPAARALLEAIDIQTVIGQERLIGRFPLARLLAGEASSVPHELWIEPETVAARAAARQLLKEVATARQSQGRGVLVTVAPAGY